HHAGRIDDDSRCEWTIAGRLRLNAIANHPSPRRTIRKLPGIHSHDRISRRTVDGPCAEHAILARGRCQREMHVRRINAHEHDSKRPRANLARVDAGVDRAPVYDEPQRSGDNPACHMTAATNGASRVFDEANVSASFAANTYSAENFV